MHKSRVIALILASMVATASVAAAQGSQVSAAAKAVEGRKVLLAGVKLSDAEKAKVKEIHKKYATENKTQRESLKSAMTSAKAARQKGDTAGARKILEATKADREKVVASMQQQQAELRAALTPEHQKQFDANLKQIAERRGAMKKGAKGKHHAHVKKAAND
jgi:Spy/CpxP family protein refolding chaperone